MILNDEITFKLNSPMTQEDWNLLADAEFEHSDSITFTTPSGNEVEFKKVKKEENKMKCPRCGSETYIIDIRESTTYGQSMRRRRVCYHCKTRFTTYEILPKNISNYCHNCGADLRGEEHGR